MKLRQLLFTIFILVAASMLTIFIYDFLTELDSDNLVTVTANNNNIVMNNHISAREIKNVTSSLTSNTTNTTVISTDSPSGSPASWILAVALLGGAVFVCGLIGIAYYSGAMDISTSSEPEAFEMNAAS